MNGHLILFLQIDIQSASRPAGSPGGFPAGLFAYSKHERYSPQQYPVGVHHKFPATCQIKYNVAMITMVRTKRPRLVSFMRTYFLHCRILCEMKVALVVEQANRRHRTCPMEPC